ncbi:MAG: SDR family oxidoreductase [Candidatus Lindowbacteria bacterium]|nr:SDR family oxidoreductase [Candidatus Lindowbacteria bacterium]
MKEKFGLDGKVAVVIGGTSGIGRAIALGLAGAGAAVVPVSRRREKVEETALEIEKLTGRKPSIHTLDVLASATTRDLFGVIASEYGSLYSLVNSAGATLKKPSVDLTEVEWDGVVDTNLKAVFFSCQAAARVMISKGRGGKIINIASLASFVGLNEVAAYCASKGGVLSLTRALGREWAHLRINVNAIAPGVFRTPLNEHLLAIHERYQMFVSRTPMGRIGHVDELVGAAVYLASPASDFVTGQSIVVDGGFLAMGV